VLRLVCLHEKQTKTACESSDAADYQPSLKNSKLIETRPGEGKVGVADSGAFFSAALGGAAGGVRATAGAAAAGAAAAADRGDDHETGDEEECANLLHCKAILSMLMNRPELSKIFSGHFPESQREKKCILQKASTSESIQR
jgi:hypothetical protein